MFRELPEYLRWMARFKVNTGCREQEVCGLRWEWEVDQPDLGTSVFRIPRGTAKNGEERVVVLNREAAKVIVSQRGQYPRYVFTYKGHGVTLITKGNQILDAYEEKMTKEAIDTN